MNLPNVSVIGIGRLGTALTQSLLANDVLVTSIFNRTEEKAQKLATSSGIETAEKFPSTLDELAQLVFLTVSDDSIETLANRLSKLDGDYRNRIFVHCSGSEPADLLDPLKSKGAKIASFHPLQTFTFDSRTDDFRNIYFSMQGDAETFPILEKTAQQLGAQTLEVTAEQKAHLHIAAVTACNYLTTLLDTSVKIGTSAGLSDEQVKKALFPLIRKTLDNAENQSFSEALTGPIKRGDFATIQNHLSLLEDHQELRNLYCLLGLQTLSLIEKSEFRQEDPYEKIQNTLLKRLNL